MAPYRMPVLPHALPYYTRLSHAQALARAHESSGELRESRSSAKTKLDNTFRPVGTRGTCSFTGDSPSHGSHAGHRLSISATERHLAQREGLRLPCLQRELPEQLPSEQSYLMRLCSQTWLPLHRSRLHLYLLMPCGLQRP